MAEASVDPRDVFNRAWHAYRERDWETLKAIYAPDAELILPGLAPIEGRDQVVQAWQRLNAAFPDDGGAGRS